MHGDCEAIIGVDEFGVQVALYDVSHLLEQHPSKRYDQRSLESVRSQYVHHSGVLRGGDPFEHMRASARYAVRKRDWPGFAYTTWIPFYDVFDDLGCRVVFRGNKTTTRTFHAGAGPNSNAVSHCLQGNMTKREMSAHQLSCLPPVLNWFAQELAIRSTPTGHFQAGLDGHAKASCPGSHAKHFVLGYQAALRSIRKNLA